MDELNAPHPVRRRRLRGLTAAALILAVAVGAGRAGSLDPPRYGAPARVVWLDQGWSEAERSWYHHAYQGTDTLPLPYAWFLALEQPVPSVTAVGLLSDPAYLDRFGFIPGVRDGNNPDGLPVGFARIRATDPIAGKPIDHVGFTCAACHTGRLTYRGTEVLVDGGPALTDVNGLRKAVALSLGLTKAPLRFERFAARVLGPGAGLAAKARLRVELTTLVAQGLGMELGHLGVPGNVAEGYGRLDALNRIGNEVFSDQMGIKANYAPLTAPVAYPHIWDAPWFDWVQYNSSIQQPMVRNAGEAMGVRALVDYHGAGAGRFVSTVPIDNLHRIEGMLAGDRQPTDARRFTGLRAPKWPQDVLGRIDPTLAAQGAGLYRQHCASCHGPAPETPEFWTGPHWLAPNAAGQRYLRPGLSRVSDVGTDEAQALDMKRRVVTVPLAMGLTGAIRTANGTGTYPYGPALGQVVEKVVTRWYDGQTPPLAQAERQRMNGFRPNGIRDGLPGPHGTEPVYKARPLDGIWATAPFLHNGSVPTLWALLSPYAERPRDFWLGNREFDAEKVGYATGEVKGATHLFTVDRQGRPIRGDANTGHLFETPADPAHPRKGTIGPTLQPPDRRALVEYLKTL